MKTKTVWHGVLDAMKSKRIISLLLSIAMLLTLTAGLDFSAYAKIFNGNCGCDPDVEGENLPNVTWELDTDKRVIDIKGEGEIQYCYDGTRSTWYDKRQYIDKAIIHSGITVIGDYAFYDCYNLKSITIPSTVREIGIINGGVFLDCYNLKDIYFIGTEEQWNQIKITKEYEMFNPNIHFLISFNDLSSFNNYCDYVAYTSVYNSFIAGTNPPYYTEFSPRTAITRAMFVAILYRMAGNPYDGANPYASNPFSDINTSAYYYNAACWALDEGITNQKTFKPNNNVTREQTARFLYAYAESKGLLGDEAYKDVNLGKYPDYNSVHSWAVEPLQWANYNDMITGTQQGYINPQGATQRIHATRILYGFGKVCNIGNFE